MTDTFWDQFQTKSRNSICGLRDPENSGFHTFLDQFEMKFRNSICGLRGPENSVFTRFRTSLKSSSGTVSVDWGIPKREGGRFAPLLCRVLSSLESNSDSVIIKIGFDAGVA